MTIRQTISGWLTPGTTAESTTTTTDDLDDLEDAWTTAVDAVEGDDSSDLVDIFDVTHSWVDHDSITINDAWWNETGRHELSDAVDEAGTTRQGLSRDIGYNETYINAAVSDSDMVPGYEALYKVEDYLLEETDVSYPIFENPVYDIKVVGATIA